MRRGTCRPCSDPGCVRPLGVPEARWVGGGPIFPGRQFSGQRFPPCEVRWLRVEPPPSPRSSQTGLPTVLAGTGGVGGVGGGVRSGQACCRGAAMFWGGTQDAQAHLIRGYVWGLLKPEGHNLFKTSMCQIVFFCSQTVRAPAGLPSDVPLQGSNLKLLDKEIIQITIWIAVHQVCVLVRFSTCSSVIFRFCSKLNES